MSRARIALVGDYDPGVTAHRAIEKCFTLVGRSGLPLVEPVWLQTESIVPGKSGALDGFSGFWCVPASPYRNTAGALWTIRFAREHEVPFLGTCGGFQHALLEYARNVLGLPHAEHSETNPDAPLPLLTRLQCSLVEAVQKIIVTEAGTFRDAYGADSGVEGFRCNYGLNPTFEHLFEEGSMQIAARSADGEARGFQLRGHRFFIGTLFQPERRALEGELHPIVKAFFGACGK
jgi:CTP synthase (UTP-ammonia lyase)